YKAKYFSILPRLTITVTLTAQTSHFKPGDLLNCQAIVNWALKRSPVNLNLLQALASSGQTAVKRKGKINLVKFRLKKAVINQLAP
ncbi:hypothetical protein, partial [Salmonella enterica]|uniref:hypothetical protein n=1 Tax=Salmonella enterica TaxID=28901 RepID=UPI003D299233